jgi:AraC-like DNA-binding protein
LAQAYSTSIFTKNDTFLTILFNKTLNWCCITAINPSLKPVLEYLPRSASESFVVKFFDYHYYPTPWHYHPEYEIVLVTESTGKRFIGDHITDFGPGNLAFIGPNLPHLYRNDSPYYKTDSGLRAKSIVIHFLEESLGKDFLGLHESEPLRLLFDRSVKGIDIVGETNKLISKKLEELLALQGLSRWLKLVEILNILAETNEYKTISRHAIKGQHEKDNDRLNKVIELVMQSFHQEIWLEDVAEAVKMSAPSFSRYFKLRTRKTFSDFVAEIRLGHASKLLQEDQLSIAEVCFACGFNNLSNFNRQFKLFYQTSPLAFRKQFIRNYKI